MDRRSFYKEQTSQGSEEVKMKVIFRKQETLVAVPKSVRFQVSRHDEGVFHYLCSTEPIPEGGIITESFLFSEHGQGNTEHILTELKKKGMRPATFEELLRFVVQHRRHSKVQFRSIIGLGTTCNIYCSCHGQNAVSPFVKSESGKLSFGIVKTNNIWFYLVECAFLAFPE